MYQNWDIKKSKMREELYHKYINNYSDLLAAEHEFVIKRKKEKNKQTVVSM